MITFDYTEAQKLAMKEVKKAIARGESPYPARLDELVCATQLAAGRQIGREQIPLALVVGTRTEGRKNAFARNFMPLLDSGSEFAAKWTALCEAQILEGIREPVLVYEYKNRFYVEEGNKRVSVLKYFNADSIDAEVIRIPVRWGPEEKEEKELYLALQRFYKISGLRTVEFSCPAGYDRLQKALGLDPEEEWTDEIRRDFVSFYYFFHREYTRLGGEGHLPGICDVMLRFIEHHGYETVSDLGKSQMQKMIKEDRAELDLRLSTGLAVADLAAHTAKRMRRIPGRAIGRSRDVFRRGRGFAGRTIRRRGRGRRKP